MRSGPQSVARQIRPQQSAREIGRPQPVAVPQIELEGGSMADRNFQVRSEQLRAGGSMGDWRDKEARNQALFREVNERIEQVAEGFGFVGDGSFICECGNAQCTQAIEVSHGEYERVRAHASRFIIALDHENPQAEAVVEQNDRYAIVEPYAGVSSRIARETDPRSERNKRARRQQERGENGGAPS